MQYTIKRRLKHFSAAHRLIKGYKGKCQHLHGHDYEVTLTFGAEQLDEHDFVIDFEKVSEYCDVWVQKNWDHAILISDADASLLAFAQQDKQKHYLFPGNINTTVERLSEHLYQQLTTLLENKTISTSGVRLLQVEIWESSKCSAQYGQG